jgi:hypothetical protein
MNRSFALLATVLALAGCGYRLAGPTPLGEPVRVVIKTDQARLVRTQAYLQTAVAKALENRLGWRVRPDGSARLELTIEPEDIQATGTDLRDIPSRWSVTVKGQALLASRHGSSIGTWAGAGYYSALNSNPSDEDQALRAAADSAAAGIATWLESESGRWGEVKPSAP